MRARFFHRALPLALTLFARAATGWIPPPSLTALLPTASVVPGSTHSIDLTLRANGAPASLNGVRTVGGAFALSVTPAFGSIVVPQDSVRRVTLSVTVPAGAVGAASLGIEITDQEPRTGRDGPGRVVVREVARIDTAAAVDAVTQEVIAAHADAGTGLDSV